MATIRSGNRTALIVVDVQKGVVAAIENREALISNAASLATRARSAKVPVIWVQHSDQELVYQSEDWTLAGDLKVEPGDHHIDKHHNSSFADTELEELLSKLGVSRIVLAGAASSWCIRATAYAALERGYDLVLASDAHGTESIQFPDGRIIRAADIVSELNVVMSYVSYPGVSNTATKSAEITF